MTDTVLELQDLHKRFGGMAVLKGINATAQVGGVIGLLGLNGAGKTTLLESALGLCPPSSGSVLLFGRNSMDGFDDTAKARVGFVPQRDELLDGMTGKRYLALISSFYRQWNNALIERLASEWQVPLDKRISALSIGQRQKLSILSALGHEPELLILDEPVASLDPVARRQFLKELVDIASSQTRTIIFSTHIVNDLERVSSRLWLLKDGILVLDEDIETLKESRPQPLEEIFLEAHQ
jgi:ABC-2 type transport system ATP-binding protein